MGGVQPAQGQTPAGTQSVGTAENTLPFDMLMQQLLGGKSTESARQSSLPFVAAPNPALGQKHTKTSDPTLTQQHTGQQHATLSLLTDNQANGGTVKISTVSPELLMRQLLASGTTARIDLGHNQQIALERSATDGPEVTVSVESLIAQAGFANGDNSALTMPQPQGEAEVPMQQPKISHADASAQQAVTANLSEPELTGEQPTQTINPLPTTNGQAQPDNAINNVPLPAQSIWPRISRRPPTGLSLPTMQPLKRMRPSSRSCPLTRQHWLLRMRRLNQPTRRPLTRAYT